MWRWNETRTGLLTSSLRTASLWPSIQSGRVILMVILCFGFMLSFCRPAMGHYQCYSQSISSLLVQCRACVFVCLVCTTCWGGLGLGSCSCPNERRPNQSKVSSGQQRTGGHEEADTKQRKKERTHADTHVNVTSSGLHVQVRVPSETRTSTRMSNRARPKVP